jgi:chromosome segregation and condensation protein ScpB
MRLDYQSADSLAPVIEALLFASDEPLSADDLRAIILGEELQRPEDPAPHAEVAADAEPALAVSAVNDEPPVASGPAP